MNNVYITQTGEETIQLGCKIGRTLVPGTVVALSGPLGSGKTTLAKGIALGIGIDNNITSPTFTLINEYDNSIPLYHIDTYRLENVEEFQEIGGEELFYKNGITVIEWCDKIASVLPKNTIQVTISINSDGSRTFTLDGAVVG